MKVSEAMSRDVQVAGPDQTLRDIATIMEQENIGSMPVGANDRLIGMITDRDITIRAVAHGKGPDTLVQDVMTERIDYCLESDEIDEVCRKLADRQLHRVPVVDQDHRLVGFLALADIARNEQNGDHVAKAVNGISRPGGH
ncbi:MAG: CBS domain-containing protein [Burkholderiaceae bacterium]